jgi:hypothetical protein
MGELGALFNPGMRHELEERQSKAARREEEGNARDGDLRIDLESGVAVININGGDDDQDGERGNGAGADADNGSGTSPEATDRPTGRHAAKSVDQDDQSAAGIKPEPPALRPRGKRGMSAANR